MNKKSSKFREKRGNRHPSQNDLPPIDKFHPDYWYYREEMDEPDDIDINYENESKNMNKKLIRLTESELRRMISESVRSTLNEQSHYDDEEKYSNSYRECIRLLEKAQSAIITDYSQDIGYDKNDPYYQHLDNRQWSIIDAITKAIKKCKEVALNGRSGTFDAENGYLSPGY